MYEHLLTCTEMCQFVCGVPTIFPTVRRSRPHRRRGVLTAHSRVRSRSDRPLGDFAAKKLRPSPYLRTRTLKTSEGVESLASVNTESPPTERPFTYVCRHRRLGFAGAVDEGDLTAWSRCVFNTMVVSVLSTPGIPRSVSVSSIRSLGCATRTFSRRLSVPATE
jgi:hypothetical protein